MHRTPGTATGNDQREKVWFVAAIRSKEISVGEMKDGDLQWMSSYSKFQADDIDLGYPFPRRVYF